MKAFFAGTQQNRLTIVYIGIADLIVKLLDADTIYIGAALFDQTAGSSAGFCQANLMKQFKGIGLDVNTDTLSLPPSAKLH